MAPDTQASHALVGAWMNFVLVFFAHDLMKAMMVSVFGANGILTSPFWFTLEGAIFGIIVGTLATRFGGEGKETVESDTDTRQ